MFARFTKGDVEILSDYDGVIYVSMDDPRGWKGLPAREIKANVYHPWVVA